MILCYEALKKALFTLEEGVSEFEKLHVNDCPMYALLRDAMIQRFEYSIDIFWKFLKLYLEANEMVVVDPASPRPVLRAAFDCQLITRQEYDALLKCITARNFTAHTYNEELAEKIKQEIPLYYTTMKTVIERINIRDLKKS